MIFEYTVILDSATMNVNIQTECHVLVYSVLFQGEKERKEASEPLIATGSDGYLEVYVSAVADPGCFWVQVGIFYYGFC